MLKTKQLTWISRMTLAGAVAVAGCASDDDGLSSDGPNQPSSATVWQECEQHDRPVADDLAFPYRRATASGGSSLNPTRVDQPGESVHYTFSVPETIPEARMVFRYARLPWGQGIPAAAFDLQLRGNGQTIRRKVSFQDTGGWGKQPEDWRLKGVSLGNLAQGQWTFKLSAANEYAKTLLDGFWIMPSTLAITATETSDLSRIRCTDHGWFGLQRGDAVINQLAGRPLQVVGRSFDGHKLEVAAAIKGLKRLGESVKLPPGSLAEGQRVELQPNGGGEHRDNGISSAGFKIPDLDDGRYGLLLSAEHPKGELETPVLVLGELLTELDTSLEKFRQWRKRLAGSSAAPKQRCLADFDHAITYLNHNRELLSDYTYDIPMLIRNTRRVMDQYNETVRRLEAGEDPYAGRTGDLRRAMSIGGKVIPYRVFVPSACARVEKIPLVVMIHGGGETEDVWPDMGDGVALKALEERGYLMISPRRSAEDENYEELFKLLNAVIDRRYPKVDRQRIFLAGHSRGGYASYELAARHPGKFRAIACISGVTDLKWARKLKGTPVLLIHGEEDKTGDPGKTRRVAAELKRLGYEHELHLFPGRSHSLRNYADEYVRLILDFFDKRR